MTTAPEDQSEREAFEAWAIGVGARRNLLDHDRWHWAWRAWQARAALRAPKVEAPDDPMDTPLPCDVTPRS